MPKPDQPKRQVLFIQGGGERVHDEWDNKLVDSLQHELGSNYEVRYPRMPTEEAPNYSSWKSAIAKHIEALDDGAIVIGHSIGATMLINVLAEHSIESKLAGVFLISAPFIGDGGWPSDEVESHKNLGAKLPKDVSIHIYHGLEDEEVPPKHADLYEKSIPRAKIHRVASHDHQFNNDLKEVGEAIRSLDR